MTSQELVETHPFAHLGPAPYRFVELFIMPSRAVLEANPEAYNAALASAPCSVGGCAHCGMGLTENYVIADADGKLHAVGSSCVLKISKGSRKITRVEHDVKLAKRQRDREKRHAREARQYAELAALMDDPATRERLAALPHPRGFKDRDTGAPLTAWDDAQWMFQNSGAAGQGRLLKALKRTLATGKAAVASKAIEVHTADGWRKFPTERDAVVGSNCSGCKEQRAETIVDAGESPRGNRILWAMCRGCADESAAENYAAREQARYDCEM